jgi:dephospho-CoA kinase
MTQRHKNLKILAFVGLKGSGKATVISYLNQKGYPKVSREDMVSQIDHLADAGQHRVITDELSEFELYKTIKHEFPAELTLVALITEKRTRHHRLLKQIGDPMNEQESSASDWTEVENDQAQLIGLADTHIENDGSIDELYRAIDELVTELGFEI